VAVNGKNGPGTVCAYAIGQGHKVMPPNPYHARYPAGSTVKIASRKILDDFFLSWRYHHKLVQQQFEFSDRVVEVKSIGFYHGGDVLYELVGVPGIWHEQCLQEYEKHTD
jgi:hypothetical protein